MGVFERDKSSGVWWVRYTPADGKIHRESVGSKMLAKQIYAKRKTQVREQHFVGPQRQHVLFSVTVDKYVLRKQNGWRSPALWLRCAKRWKERFGNRTLASITRADIQREVEQLRTRLSPASVNRELTFLKAFFTDAVNMGLAANNPARLVKRYRENNFRVRALTESEESRLMMALPSQYRHWFDLRS